MPYLQLLSISVVDTGKFKDLGLDNTKKIDAESVAALLEQMRVYKSGIDISTFKSNAKW